MRKQLGILTSLIFLCATAFCWAGGSYYNNNCCDQYAQPVCTEPCKPACCPQPCKPVCKPRCAPPCRPVCKPACPPPCEPECVRPVTCKYGPNMECCVNGITVRAKQPKLCILGDTYVMDVETTACVDVCDVVVNANLPDGVSFVRSQPEGVTYADGRLTWKFASMSKGETKCSRVWLKADREGDLCVCFCATAVPVQFCSILCAKPQLSCEKCGPEEACPGDDVPFTITVTNHGSCAAEEVVVTDNVPDGLEHSSGQRTLTFRLGTLQPCETKRINVCFTAARRCRVCNTVQVTACNANPVSCQWCVNICCCNVELYKTGPKEVQIGKNADYQITVVNSGDKPLTDVVITDNAPTATSIVDAKGACVAGNQAIWRLKELKPGEKQTFNLTLTTCTPGYFCNKVHVDDCQGCTADAEACTRWKGRPALNVCIEESDGPLCVGEPDTYTIRVVNQGSEEDTNLKVVVNFPKEIAPVSASGPTPGQVNGQTVTFAPVQVVGPRQALIFRVTGQAKESTGQGDARIRVEVSSDSIKTPIVQEESTVVN